MKPIKLVMKAFGPYADEQVIDFTELKDKNMFLIHGRTGSGKTSILDGICFALYGDSSGNERDGKSLRSHFADINELTEVSLEFEIRGQKYRIKRIPQQERAKKSGEGTTIQNPEAILWKKKNDKEEVIATKPTKVDKKIEEIIGFESNQFRQVIMIPQGQFRKLLTAKSEERQEIMEKIFNTENYMKIEKFIKEKARKLKTDIDKQKDKEYWFISQIKCYEEDEIKTFLDDSNKNPVIIIDKLKELIDRDNDKSSSIQDSLNIQDLQLAKKQEKLSEVKQNNKKIEEKEKLGKELKILKEQKEIIDKKRITLENGRKALTLIEIEKTVQNRSKEKQELEKELKNKQNELILKEKEFNKSKKQLEIENSKEDERKSVEKRILELEGFVDKVKKLESNKKEIKELEKKLKQIEDKKLKYDNEIQILSKDIEDKEVEIDKIRELKDDFLEQNQGLGTKKELYDKRLVLIDKYQEHKRISKEGDNAKLILEKINNKFKKAKEDYERTQDIYIKGQAGILADELKDGLPCPVCGSIHHPNIAIKEEWMPKKEDIKYKKDLLNQFEKEKEDSKKEYDEILVQIKTIKNSIITKEEELGEFKEIDVSVLKAEIDELQKKSNELKAKIDSLDKLESETKSKKEKVNKLREEYRDIDKELIEIKGKYQLKKGAFEAIIKDIPQEINTESSLGREIKSATQLQKNLKISLEKSKKEFDDANNKLIDINSAINQTVYQLNGIEEKYRKEKKEFIESMHKTGFMQYQDYANSKKTEVEINKIEQVIREYDLKFRSKKDSYEKAVKETQGIETKNIKTLQDKLIILKKERDDTVNKLNTLSNKITDNKKVLNDIGEIKISIKNKEKEYSIIGDLSETANGKNPHGITFERFVLSALLDDIVISANHRLLKMSGGRYILNRTQERERKNAQSGLELEVFDNNTGQPRNVSTLSGGEGFISSLSLALGLADVVQSYSGGISLETMFIDEGFGTLDPESLDYAIKTLIDLQKDGRLIGIISHVPELKERIDARLEVISTNRGSVAKFNIL